MVSVKNILFISIIFFVIGSCSKQITVNENDKDIYGLASPVYIPELTGDIYLADYFVSPEEIESFKFEYKPEYSYDTLNHIIHVDDASNLPEISELIVTVNSVPYSILIIKPFKLKYNFTFNPSGKKYDSVLIKGTMNSWNPQLGKLTYKKNKWVKEFYIKPGDYQYKLILNGKEKNDPTNPDSLENSMGGFNSVLKIKHNSSIKRPEIHSAEYSKKEIKIQFLNSVDEVYVLWENTRINNVKIDKNTSEFSFYIPKNAKTKKRSHIRIYARNTAGRSNDILIPLEYGDVIESTNKLARTDKQSIIMYFLMIDRFFDGNTNNNHPVDDPDILPKANYFGGDLEGVIAKINSGYFDNLGINTIWVSPITQNPLGAYGLYPDPYTKFSGYHGYWPISSTTVDFRFGNEKVLDSLVKTAHEKDMNFFLDYVANHVHELHPVYQQNPYWATKLYLPDGSLNTERWDEYRLTTWFDTFLPTLDLTKKDVVEPMTDSAVFWVKKYHIDGFRHDATKHIDELFWRTLTKKLKQTIPEEELLYQIGETYGSRELIASYIGSGMLDAQFDFSIYDDAVAVFAKDNEPFTRLTSSLKASLEQYGSHHLMGNITGNQDKARFISYAGGAVLFEEDAKLAGWKRNIGVGNPNAYDKLKLLHAWNMAIPGIPVIYYGDEIGMPGGNDPDNRRMMCFKIKKDEESEVRSTVSKLALLRKENMPLLYGETSILYENNTSCVLLRTYFDQAVLIVFNKDDKPGEVKLELPEILKDSKLTSAFNQQITVNNNTLNIILEPYSFDYLIKSN